MGIPMWRDVIRAGEPFQVTTQSRPIILGAVRKLVIAHVCIDWGGLCEQVFDVAGSRLPGVKATAQFIRHFLEASDSIIHVAFASRLIVATPVKSIRET